MATQVAGTYSNISRKDRPVIQIQKYKSNGDVQRLYYSFSSYERLEQWVRSRAHTSFFEVIDNGDQKFRLDLESTSVTREEWERKVPILIDITRAMIRSKKYIRFESMDRNNRKLSEHIVFTDVYVESSKDALLTLNDLILTVNKVGASSVLDIVDTGVYNTIQHFRMEGATKLGEGRYKYVKGKSSLSKSILPGLIKYTKDCNLYTPKSTNVTEKGSFKEEYKRAWVYSK